jgi:diguanylate cyclase (GGDEF)-like protein
MGEAYYDQFIPRAELPINRPRGGGRVERGRGRAQVVLGLVLGVSLAFLGFLLVRPVGEASIRLTANLAQLLAPLLAAAGCGWAAAAASGRTRRAWALLAASAGSWALGQATWVWYEHVSGREQPFPSLADVGYLLAIPLAAAAMLAFPGQAERAAQQVRSLLDGAVIAVSLLYTSWAMVLGPVFRAGEGGLAEQAIALAYPAGDVALATIVLVVATRTRAGGVPLLLLGTGLLGLAVADTGFAFLTQQGTYRTGSPSDVGWFAGYLLVGAAAVVRERPWPEWPLPGPPPGRAQTLLPYGPLALAVATSVALQLEGHERGPFLYWTFLALVLLIVGRQLLAVLDNQALNRRLAAMVGRLEHQAFHDGLTGLANRALFRERVEHALRRRSQAGTPLALLFIDLDDFKTVNDDLGHAAGDDLLVAVAGRLKTCVRSEDTVARLGGDEFAILLEQASGHELAVRVAGRVLQAMEPAFRLEGREVRIGASVGVTVSDAQQVDAVLREADMAMYMAKAHGKGRFELASASV